MSDYQCIIIVIIIIIIIIIIVLLSLYIALWTKVSSAFQGRSQHTSHLLDGVIYVFGGYATYKGGIVYSNILIFNIYDYTWSTVNTNPYSDHFPARYGHTSVIANGILGNTTTTDHKETYILVIGGRDKLNTYNDLWKFYPHNSTWEAIELVTDSLVFPARYSHSAAVHQETGLVYVIGGQDTLGRTFNDVWVFDCVNLKWKALITLENACAHERKYHTTVINEHAGILYTMGGEAEGSKYYSDTWVFYTNSLNPWHTLTYYYGPHDEKFQGRQRHTAVLDTINQKMYIIGGSISGLSTNEIWCYDIATSYIRPITSRTFANGSIASYDIIFPARFGHVSIFHSNGTIYTIGGSDDGISVNNDIYAYGTQTYTWWKVSMSNDDIIEPNNTFPARQGHGGIIAADLIYILGGRNRTDVLNDIWLFDIKKSKWIQQLQLNHNFSTSNRLTARWQHTCVYDSRHNNIYVIGGNSDLAGTSFLNDIWLFSVSTKTLTLLSTTGETFTPRALHSSVIDDYAGMIYTSGGYGKYKGGILKDVMAFDIKANKWSTLSVPSSTSNSNEYLKGYAGHTSVISPSQGFIYNIGGVNSDLIDSNEINLLSGLEILAPTPVPTTFPTYKPTRLPTYFPTSCTPTQIPTSILPTVISPTLSPSFEPTYLPTTNKPYSISPLNKNSVVPTLDVSHSHNPTFNPTKTTGVISPPTTLHETTYITVIIKQYIGNVSYEDFVESGPNDIYAKLVFKITIAEVFAALGVSETNVTMNNITASQLDVMGSRNLMFVTTTTTSSKVHVLTIIYTLSVPSFFSDSDSDKQKVYLSVVQTLSTSLTTGSFTSMILNNAHSWAVVGFDNVVCYHSFVSLYDTPSLKPLLQPTVGPSEIYGLNFTHHEPAETLSKDALIMGISIGIGVILFIIIVLAALTYRLKVSKNTISSPQHDDGAHPTNLINPLREEREDSQFNNSTNIHCNEISNKHVSISFGLRSSILMQDIDGDENTVTSEEAATSSPLHLMAGVNMQLNREDSNSIDNIV